MHLISIANTENISNYKTVDLDSLLLQKVDRLNNWFDTHLLN